MVSGNVWMRYNVNQLSGINWTESGAVTANGSSVNFTGLGKVVSYPKTNLIPEKFSLYVKASNSGDYTDKYNPTAFVNIQFQYVDGNTFKGSYPIIGGLLDIEPDISEAGEINSDFDQYPITNFKVEVVSAHPINIVDLRIYKRTKDVVVERPDGGGITKDEYGNYVYDGELGDGATGGDGIGSIDLYDLEIISYDRPQKHTTIALGPFTDDDIMMGVHGVDFYDGRINIPQLHTGRLFPGLIVPDNQTTGVLRDWFNGGGGDYNNQAGWNWEYRSFIPVVHTAFDAESTILPNVSPDAYVDGYVVSMMHFRRPEMSSTPSGETIEAMEFLDDEHVPPAWAPKPSYGGFGPDGPHVIKYLYANDGRIYISWGDKPSGREQTFYLTNPFSDVFQVVHGYQIGGPPEQDTDYDDDLKYIEDQRVPVEWVLATDDDFKSTSTGFEYIGNDRYITIPKSIRGVELTSYRNMFNGTDILGARNASNSNITDMRDMFSYGTGTILNVSELHTGSVTTMSSMFAGTNVRELDLSNFDTSNVTDMRYMFNSTRARTIDVSSFDTSKVKNMTGMFSASYGARYLTRLNLSNFDTSSVEKMDSMFSNSWVKHLDLSSFNTSKVWTMSEMFVNSKIETLNVSNFDTDEVMYMKYMFSDTIMNVIDISSFSVRLYPDVTGMFRGAEATIGYAGSTEAAERFNTSPLKPEGLLFRIK